ncbi:MAG: sugar phosphate nucleotidyltransferase [Acidilobaceae archaeon]
MASILAILAAGRGERLRPITETRPKPLVPILGEPIVCRHIRLALETGVYNRIIVVASYMIDNLREALSKCGFNNAEIIDQGGEYGTGHAILKVLQYGGPGDYTVIYSDIYMSRDGYYILANLRAPAILASRTSTPWEFGVLDVKEGVLRRVVEKPKHGEVKSDLVFAGALKINWDFLDYFLNLSLSPRGEYEVTEALNNIASRSDVYVEVLESNTWVDIGRPWDLLVANRVALKSELKTMIKGEVHPTAVIDGEVVIEEGAQVKPYTVIEGPAYIGKSTVIGPHSHLRAYNVILDNARIGSFTQVKASIILEYSRVPHLNYVGDSIVGEYSNLGAGTIIANYRFDEANVKVTIRGERIDSGLNKLGALIGGYVKTGINVSILPGIKIGSRAWIWPGCLVNRDVESGERYNCWATR